MKMKNNVQKFLFNMMAIILLLPSFLSLCFGINNLNITHAETIQSIQTADSEETLTKSEQLLKQSEEIPQLVTLTQSGIVFKSENFKMQSLTLTEIERNTASSSTLMNKPIYNPTNNNEKELSSIFVTGENSYYNVLNIVGAINISLPQAQNDSNKVEMYIHAYNYNSDNTHGAYYRTSNCVYTTKTATASNGRYQYTISAANNTAKIYKVTLYYNYVATDREGLIFNPTEFIEFFIYQANNITLDNNMIDWFENVQSTSILNDNKIYQPGNNQIYQNTVQVAFANAFNNVSNLYINGVNQLYVEFWHNGQAYKLVMTKIIDNYTNSTNPEYRLAVLNYFVDPNINILKAPKIVSYYGLYYSYSTFCNKVSLVKGSTETQQAFDKRVEAFVSENNGHIFQDVSAMFLGSFNEMNRLNAYELFANSGYFTYLSFEESGDYKIRIYDNTSTYTFPTSYQTVPDANYDKGNICEYNFSVENVTDLAGFYYTLISQKDQNSAKTFVVATEERPNNIDYTSELQVQSVNNPVTISFNNIDSHYISQIRYDKYSIDGNDVLLQNQIIAKTNTSSVMEIGSQYKLDGYGNNAQFTLAEEGTYYFFIELFVDLKTGQTAANQSSPMAHNLIRISFQILNGVRQSYNYLGKVYPTDEDTGTLSNNTVKTYTFDQTYTSTYSLTSDRSKATFNASDKRSDLYHIYGTTDTAFKLQIAKSVPTITGIKHQSTTSNAVNIVASGVATGELSAHITVTRDGSVIFDKDLYNQNDENAFTYTLSYGASDLGKYVVTITDAMNNTGYIQFTIAKEQNFAAILLIIVGIAIGSAAVIFIIRARSKVTVR